MARAAAAAAAILTAGPTVLLQGCGGGGGGGGGPTTTTAVTTTTVTTTTYHPRTPPMSTEAAVSYLNTMYTSFDPDDDSTDLGLTVSMAANDTSFFGNMFCSEWGDRPGGRTGCSQGRTDCRMSASLLSHRWMIDATTKVPTVGLSRLVGYVFNQTMVESKWARCSFIWDGATNNRYNRGCGDGAPGDKCDSNGEAFYNICPSTKKTCTEKDEEVQRALCKPWGGAEVPETHDGHVQCIFPGAAIDYRKQEGYKPGKDFTREMAKKRIALNNGKDKEGPNIEKWNEVVLDDTLLIEDLWWDPAVAIPAFIYTKSKLPESRQHAQQMRDEFCEYYHVDKIPLVEVDDLQYNEKGPFTAPTDELPQHSEVHF